MQDKQKIIGKFLKRYNRFLVDIELDNGKIVTAHCTNSGSLRSCLVPGAEVIITPAENPNRKTKYTWQMIKIGNSWVGVHTGLANELAYNLLKNNKLPQFQNLTLIEREKKLGNSRIDIYAEKGQQKIWIEVKNVTYREGKYALFPDAKTTRGQKHLYELIEAKKQGFRTAMFFIVQRIDTEIFAPAWHIDPVYSQMLKEAVAQGVEIYPLQFKITPEGAEFIRIMDYTLDDVLKK